MLKPFIRSCSAADFSREPRLFLLLPCGSIFTRDTALLENGMADINWDKLDYFDLTPLQSTSSGIPIPTYGNFGGPGYSQGVFLVDPDPAQFDPTPVDALDQQFMLHDEALAAADTTS